MTTPIKITYEMLKEMKACSRGLDLFQELFQDQEIEITLENLKLFEQKCKEKYGFNLKAQWCILASAIQEFVDNHYCNSLYFCIVCPLYYKKSAEEVFPILNSLKRREI